MEATAKRLQLNQNIGHYNGQVEKARREHEREQEQLRNDKEDLEVYTLSFGVC